MSKREEFVPLAPPVEEYELNKKSLYGVMQGSIQLNKAFGNMQVHFHFEGTTQGKNSITIKKGDKILLEGITNNKSGMYGQGIYKIPIMNSYFLGKFTTPEEFKDHIKKKNKKKK